MGDHHTSVQKYSLSEHAQLRRSLHHEVLLEHQRQGRIFLPENFTSRPGTSAASEWAVDDYYFLQPVPTRQRRAILRDAGVVRIDPVEREECRSLRVSRGRCGCSCREFCRPPSCACYRSGISCQVDQMAFPCPCSRAGCANPYGRVEFNAARVRAHFIRTLLQLGLEQNQSADCDDGGLSPPAKRCRLMDDHLPTSFASSSSSSSLLNSVCTDVVSVVSTSNGFESQPVYFQSPQELSGPETTVAAYDENYDEMGDESSSETSSDSCVSFDNVVVNDVADTAAGTLCDARQRTLDNYVIRFSRHHTYADTAVASGYGLDGFHSGVVPHSSVQAPLSCTMTGLSSSEPFHPLMGLRTEMTAHAGCLSDNVPRAYCLTSVRSDDSRCPAPMSSGDHSVSLATRAGHTQAYCTTDRDHLVTGHHTAASCGYFTQQQTTSIALAQPTAIDDCNTDNTVCDHSTLDNNIHIPSSYCCSDADPIVDNTHSHPSYYHCDADPIVRSCSTAENSACDGSVQGSSVDGSSVPFDQGHESSYSVPDYAINSCSEQRNVTLTSVADQNITVTAEDTLAFQNIMTSSIKCDDIASYRVENGCRTESDADNCVADSNSPFSCPISVADQKITPSTVARLKRDNIEVTAAVMPSYRVENGCHAGSDVDNFIADYDSRPSCPLSDTCSEARMAGNEALMSEDTETRVTMTEHSSLTAETITRSSCPLSDTCGEERKASDEASVSQVSETQNDIAPVTV